MILGLERYFNILDNKSIAKFQLVKRIEAEKFQNLEDMLKHHEELKKEFYKLLKSEPSPENILELKIPDYSFLDLKIDILLEKLKSCEFCERKCKVNRYIELGYCKCSHESYFSSEFLHFGEEPELIPSYTIFFNRCTFSCVYCQNYEIVLRNDFLFEPKVMGKLVDMRFKQGARNVNLVGGNPDQHSHNILKMLKYVTVNIPIVWNSNMYHSVFLHNIIEDIVDVWLGDFKYGNNKCANKLSKVNNYWEVVTRNFLLAKKTGELLIRHLVLPNHLECCTRKILEWISKNLGKNTRVNIMFQYYPCYNAKKYPEINRRLNSDEMKKALQIAKEYNLSNLVL